METILPADTEYHGVPYVGCAATQPVGSDSYPGTIVWVSTQTVEHEYTDRKTGLVTKVTLPRRIHFKRCDYRGLPGHNNAYTENQEYQYFDDGERQSVEEYSWRDLRRNYVSKGTSSKSSAAQGLYFGYRRAYRDPSF